MRVSKAAMSVWQREAKKRLAKHRPLAIRRSRAMALVRRIQSTNIVRYWNVHASENGWSVWLTDEMRNLNALKKHMGFRHKVRPSYSYNGRRWGTITIQLKGAGHGRFPRK